MKKLFAMGALVALAGLAAAQVDPLRVVAVVNGDPIKGAEYYSRMEYLPHVGERVGTSFAEFPPGFMTLEQLITERLLLKIAKDKGVYPTDAEVERELQVRQEDNPKFLEDWTRGGHPRAELDYQLRVELARFKIQTFGINKTDQEVKQFFDQNPDHFTIPQRYKLRVIAVDGPDAEKAVDADLVSGKSFSDVAKARSLDVTKDSGGDFGTIPLTGFANLQIRDAISHTKVGTTTEWLGSTGTFAKFLVEDVVPAQKIAMSPSVLRQTRNELMLQKGMVKNDAAKLMAAERAKAKIDIKDPAFADAYKKFIDAYLKGVGYKSGG